MNYICIADWDENGAITADAEAVDEAMAIQKVASMVVDGYPNAFYAVRPVGVWSHFVVNANEKTVTFDNVQHDIDVAENAWMKSIADSDKEMPRWFEDVVTSGSVILKPGRTKDNYDTKVALRNNRPT